MAVELECSVISFPQDVKFEKETHAQDRGVSISRGLLP